MAVDRFQIFIEAIDKASAQISSIQKSVLGLAGAYLTFQTAQRVFQLAVDQIGQAIEAASQQEQADIRLANAVATLGGNTARMTAHLKEQASALQLTTIYTDEQVQAAQALLVSLGRLSGEGLDRATKAAVALAQGLGVDLESAATLLAKAAAGSTASLARYGIVLDESLSKSEKFEAVLKFVEGRFGTLAEAMGSSFQGRLTQVNHQWGELQETLGNAIIKNDAILSILKEITTALGNLNSQFAENKLDENISQIAISLTNLTDRVFVAITAMSALFDFLRHGVAAVAAFALQLADPQRRFEGMAASFGADFQLSGFTQTLLDLSNAFHGVATNVDEAHKSLVSMKAELAQIQKGGIAPSEIARWIELRDALGVVKPAAAAVVPPLQDAGETAKEAAERIKKLHDAIEGTDLSFTRLGPTVRTSADDAVALMEKIAVLRTEIELSGVSAGPLIEKLNEMAAALEAIQVGAGFAIVPVIGDDQSVQLATFAEQWDLLTEKQQIFAGGVADLGGQFVQMGIAGELTFKNLAAAVRQFVAQLIAAIIRMLILQAIARAFGAALGGGAGGAAAGAVVSTVAGGSGGFGPSLSAPLLPITPNVQGLGGVGGSQGASLSIQQGFLGVSDAFVRDLNEAQSRIARDYGVSIVPLGSLA